MKVIAALLLFFGLVIGIVPQFTDCASQGRFIELGNGRTMPMKCHWTAQAEIAVAAPMLAVGGLMTVSHGKENRRALSILGIILGVFAILIPTYLVGVCASFEMLCNSAMKPTLIFGGVVVAVASLIGLATTNRDDRHISIQSTDIK